MRAGRAAAAAAGLAVARTERVAPLGEGWLIHDKKGFQPCPWAFDLARFAPARPGDRVLDLGTGTGVLLAALHQVHPGLRALVGLELDARSADQARRNAALNGFADRAVFARADVRAAPVPPRAFDLVVSNPPFYPAGWGRESRDGRVRQATHATAGDVGDFLRVAAGALAPHGRVVVVFDAGHLTALLRGFASAGLTVRALRFLVDDRGLPARVLALAGRDGGGLIIDDGGVTP